MKYLGKRSDLLGLESLKMLQTDGSSDMPALEPGEVFIASLDQGSGERIFMSRSWPDILELEGLRSRCDDVRINWYMGRDPLPPYPESS